MTRIISLGAPTIIRGSKSSQATMTRLPVMEQQLPPESPHYHSLGAGTTALTISADAMDTMNQNDWLLSQLASPPVLLLVALTLGVLANGWIQRMLSGEQGLASFLSDGAGFNKSGFKPLRGDADRAVQSDPLPWLRLPDLDFVEVAGQEQLKKEEFERGQQQQVAAIAELELLRLKMQEQLVLGNIKEADALRQELESAMRESGVQFLED